MKHFKRKLAVLPHTVDGLCIDWNAVAHWEPWYLVEADSTEEQWAKSFLPHERVLGYSCTSDASPEVLLTTSTIPEVLRAAGVDALLFTDSMTAALSEWAESEGITMVVTPYATQEKFENKIWFDGFMTRNHIPHPAGFVRTFPQDAGKMTFPCVIQGAQSRGGEETYVVKTHDELMELMEKSLRSNTPYLVREFVEGVAQGVTVLVTNEVIALSAPCMQCFYPGHMPLRFAGVQFQPTDTLSDAERAAFDGLFLHLGHLLYAEGYRGYANFDYIRMYDGSVKVIECNPRFTATSAHHNLFPQLFSGLPSGALFVDDFAEGVKKGTPKDYPLSRETFAGSLLFGYQDARTSSTSLRASGTYTLQNGTCQFVGPGLQALQRHTASFFLYAEPQIATRDSECITDTILSAEPLFEPSGELNERGLEILSLL